MTGYVRTVCRKNKTGDWSKDDLSSAVRILHECHSTALTGDRHWATENHRWSAGRRVTTAACGTAAFRIFTTPWYRHLSSPAWRHHDLGLTGPPERAGQAYAITSLPTQLAPRALKTGRDIVPLEE
jgi:hypothetical protein